MLPHRPARLFRIAATVVLLTLAGGCTSVYHSVLDDFTPVREDRIPLRVDEARDGQRDARRQLRTTRSHVRALLDAEPADHDDRLRGLIEHADRTDDLIWDARKRIASVRDVAASLADDGMPGGADGDPAPPADADRRYSLDRLRAAYARLNPALDRADGAMAAAAAALASGLAELQLPQEARAAQRPDHTVLGELDAVLTAAIEELGRSIEQADAFLDAVGRSEFTVARAG